MSARFGYSAIRRVAAAGQSSRGPVLSLRHHAIHGARARRVLEAAGARRVLVVLTDLRSFATLRWALS
jgi:hypothetical protein